MQQQERPDDTAQAAPPSAEEEADFPSTATSAARSDLRGTIDGEALHRLENLKVSTLHSGMLTPDVDDNKSPAGGSSPSASQVSVQSVGPTLALLNNNSNNKPFDLTPVTRNTSREYVDRPVGTSVKPVVSPDDANSNNNSSGRFEELHGEHLALPADLGSPHSGPSLPLARGSGGLDEALLRQHDLHQAVEFEPTRKFPTFTSREQYEALQQQQQQGAADVAGPTLQPYQPTRLEPATTTPANIDQIFAPRQRNRSPQEEEQDKNHRLTQAFPLDNVSSIPSLHLATQLQASSTLSLTSLDYDVDDESSLQLQIRGGDDNASLSSRGSSLYMPGTGSGDATAPVMLGPRAVVLEELHRLHEDESNDEQRRKKKHRKQEEQQRRVMDWLQSVEGDQNDLAEAASSKFLTQTTTTTTTQPRRLTMPVTSDSDFEARKLPATKSPPR